MDLNSKISQFGRWPIVAGVAAATIALVTVIGMIISLGSDNGDDSEIRVEPTMIADPGDSDSSATSSTSISGALMRMPSRFDSREPNRVFALVELADGGRAAGFGTVLLEPTEVTATTQVAAPDGRGGVVYTAEGELWWLGESATGPTLLDDSGRRADLVGLRHVDGEPVVVALIDNELVGYDQGERRFAETFDQFSGEIVELAIDGDLAVAVVSRGDGAAAVESLSLATGEHQEVAAPVDTKEPTAPLAVAVSDGRIVILNRSAGAVVVTSDGTETGTVNLGVEALDIYSVDLAGDKVLLAFGESALAIDIVTAEREVVPTPAGWVLGAVWGDVDLGSQPVAPGEAERFRVDTEKVEADTGDPYLNVRLGPGTDNEILAKLPSTYTGLLWTGQQETTPNGATWYEVELLDPVRITPSEPLHGATPSGWVASAFIVALPEGLPATLDDVEGCAETHNTIDRGSGSRQPGHIYALESVLVAPNCLRVVLTFGTGTAPFTMEEADEGLAPANALPQIHGYMSGGSGSYLDLGDIDSVWPGTTETADGVYVVRQDDGSLQLWSTQPTRRTTVEGLSDRGIVVIDLTLDPASSPPATGPGVVLTRPLSTWPGSVEVTGIARPFEAMLEVQIEDDTGAPVSAIYSGSLRLGTRRAGGYGVETNDWTEAWAPFAVRAEGLTPGDYTLVLEAEASGDPRGGLRIPFSVTEAGPVPELPSEEELGAIQALVDFARGTAGVGTVPLADEVTLGLGLAEPRTLTRSELAEPDAWVSEVTAFAGFDGGFSALTTLAQSGPVRSTAGPIPHCAGPPRDWPAEYDGLRQINIEPIGIDSCISWFGVSVFLDSSDQIAGVVLDLFGP